MSEKPEKAAKMLLYEKSENFAIRIINLNKYLVEQKKESVMLSQVLRSGTSIGANFSETLYAQSLSDFHSKAKIALKEASETRYWLNLLYKTGYLELAQFKSINADCEELIKLLTATCKTTDVKNK